MRILRISIALILAAALSLAVVSASFASKADDLLEQGAKAGAQATTAKGETDKTDYYKKAVEKYNEVVSKYPDKVQGPQALYELVVLDRDMAATYKNTKDQSKYLYQAYNTSKQLIGTYDVPASQLEDKYNLEPSEARQILDIVSRTKTLEASVTTRLDNINSHDIKYKILDFFVRITGSIPGFSYWFAIILITVIVKILITPLTKAQFKSMKEMQKVAPLIKEVQEKHKGDQKTIGEKTMAIYKEHNINPFASCLPLLVQMPVLMLMFYMIKSYEFQFAKGGFLWIGSGLSHLWSFVSPIGVAGHAPVWVTARNLAEPDLVLVVLYVISMYISTKLSAVDPTQAEQQKMMAIMMPVMFAFIFMSYPSAFLLYWLVFNILQTAQQYYILRGARAETAPAVVPPAEPESGGEDRITRPRRGRRRR